MRHPGPASEHRGLLATLISALVVQSFPPFSLWQNPGSLWLRISGVKVFLFRVAVLGEKV